MIDEQEFILKLRQKKYRLNEVLDSFKNLNLLVIGDLTLDEFLTGEVERLSREAPVLILRHEDTNQIPGGGANAVYNLAKLGANIRVAGYVGDDIQGDALLKIFESANIDTRGIIKDYSRPTVTKTRIAGHARQSVTQQIVRVDRKSDTLPSEELQSELSDYIDGQLYHVDGVVCSDYGDGVFTQPIIKSSLNHHLVVVDTQKDLQRFSGATLFTPNLPEAELAVGYAISDDASVLSAGKDLLAKTQAKYILITRGEEGMSLFSYQDNLLQVEHIPAFNRTDVFDVTGAGDTVVAALSLALCSGATPWEAAVLGNLAASIVVRVFGTATTSIEEMKEALNIYLEEN
ncbi:bifunctional heptose 7-phosphate kinase/heptose 1-phosphate adenyltransferase [Cyanobacterium sp. IPPAS B-1200]|uniref:bifunctional heptose 7-phosphate kinase/heptose 1-phosphate adenyltransferase n=1 Tax=Cyanobacterium sp. IPPAS B-1200 TaxID=1562720 RepID=UPI0008525320|nr:PfkB family carbohydrate kinase [Cyanobacterium sp. IPPAS B-1200]OEJ79265.1 ADP-heptose synthase [Cyanobacterium sp. IPPAS B-1200]